MSVAVENRPFSRGDEELQVNHNIVSELKRAIEGDGLVAAYEGVYMLGSRDQSGLMMPTGFNLNTPGVLKTPSSFEQLVDKVQERDPDGTVVKSTPPNDWINTVFAYPRLSAGLMDWNLEVTHAAAKTTKLEGRSNFHTGLLNNREFRDRFLESPYATGEMPGLKVIEVLERGKLENVPASFVREVYRRGMYMSIDDFSEGNHSHHNAAYMRGVLDEIHEETGEDLDLEIKVNPLDICEHVGKDSLEGILEDIFDQMSEHKPTQVVVEGLRFQRDIEVARRVAEKYPSIKKLYGQSRDWKSGTSIEEAFDDRIRLEELPDRLAAEAKPIFPRVHNGQLVGVSDSAAHGINRLIDERIGRDPKAASQPLLPEARAARHTDETRKVGHALRALGDEVKGGEWILTTDPSIAEQPKERRAIQGGVKKFVATQAGIALAVTTLFLSRSKETGQGRKQKKAEETKKDKALTNPKITPGKIKRDKD